MTLSIQRSLSRGMPLQRASTPLLPVCSSSKYAGRKRGNVVMKITAATILLALCAYGAFAFVFLGKATDTAVAQAGFPPQSVPGQASQQDSAASIHSRLVQAREVARRSQLEHEERRQHEQAANHGSMRHEASGDLRHVEHTGVHVRRVVEPALADAQHPDTHQQQQADPPNPTHHTPMRGAQSGTHGSDLPADVVTGEPHLEEAHRQHDWDRAGVHAPGTKAKGVIEAPEVRTSPSPQQHTTERQHHYGQHETVTAGSTAQHHTQQYHGASEGGRQLEVEQVTPELIRREELFEKDVFGSHPIDGPGHTQTPHSSGGHDKSVDSAANAPKQDTGVYALSAEDINGHWQPLSKYQGKVSLIVNVASQCGYTDENYKGLQATYDKYKNFGLEILAFPCNQFGAQEPGSQDEIKHFCSSRYQVTFPLFNKIEVNGPHEHPIYTYLKQHAPLAEGGGSGAGAGEDIGWNFYKFLVGKDGRVLHRWNQRWNTGAIERAIYEALTAKYEPM